jgi:hypothetical protein
MNFPHTYVRIYKEVIEITNLYYKLFHPPFRHLNFFGAAAIIALFLQPLVCVCIS